VTTSAATHTAAARSRRPGRAIAITPAVSAATGPMLVNRVPSAIPAARPDAATAAGRWTRRAAAARISATAITSLRASPAWSANTPASRTTKAPSTARPPTPQGRPRHHAASSASASQPMLITGESRSRSNTTIPAPCRSSELAG
jgi:hypothetical protein